MKAIIYCLLFMIYFSASAVMADTVYKSTDAEGNTSFSDAESPGSEVIEIQAPQTYSLPPLQNATDSPSTTDQNIPVNYQIAITDPPNNQTLTTDLATIPVSLSIEPSLVAGDKVQLLLNGEPYGGLYDTTSITIAPDVRLERGEYTIQAQIVSVSDPSKIKAQSNVVTVFQKRHTILLPRN